MIVVLDTNICIPRLHLLGNEAGQQLVNLLEARKAQLFLPQILRREYGEQAHDFTRMYEKKTVNNSADIRTLLGLEVPAGSLDRALIEQSFVERLRSLEHLILLGPTEEELFAAAGRRVLAKKPPVTEKNEFKDSMIWEAVLTLPAGAEVWLISNDNGFYDEKGFHQILVDESRERGLTVYGHRRHEPLLEALRNRTPEIDLAASELTDKTQNPAEAEVSALIPPAPAARAEATEPAIRGREVEQALRRIQATFEQNDARVLGLIAALGSPGKERLFAVCEQVGITRDVARNCAERLSHGEVRDTGSHYLIPDAALAEAARTSAQPDLILLLNQERADGL